MKNHVVHDTVGALRGDARHTADSRETTMLNSQLFGSNDHASKSAKRIMSMSHGSSAGVRTASLELNLEPPPALDALNGSNGVVGFEENRALFDVQLKVGGEGVGLGIGRGGSEELMSFKLLKESGTVGVDTRVSG